MKLKFAAILHSLVVAALALPTPNPSIPEARACNSRKAPARRHGVLLVASKFEDTISPAIENFIFVCNGAYTGADMNSGSAGFIKAARLTAPHLDDSRCGGASDSVSKTLPPPAQASAAARLPCPPAPCPPHSLLPTVLHSPSRLTAPPQLRRPFKLSTALIPKQYPLALLCTSVDIGSKREGGNGGYF
ncbi:hypothetical protein B0H14DRAFT_3527514 [Mycena olivaceomarginata]|nr:hypothetical protein B0H14DRAFT_3527514 [Mycena olivaceomarginata]